MPSDLKSGTASVNPSKWGTPSAAWPSGSSCNISHFFTPQQLVIDITLCGDLCVHVLVSGPDVPFVHPLALL